ncbi:hypothetical protein [Litoreibacter roseus]|uniref:Uncharacterized protein n=1 Tax=Litoreibacter roseus TaxID=2601869 RepID=A0A6N6JJU0_9RHOB|nr:hypothetical protein [Litoreibacter roseus]GFE65538.1 hypothetical protein KIN_26120 [Litoreibacter roseus]
MTKKQEPQTPATRKKTASSREDRLKAALKANMGRRKAQTRARQAAEANNTSSENEGQ